MQGLIQFLNQMFPVIAGSFFALLFWAILFSKPKNDLKKESERNKPSFIFMVIGIILILFLFYLFTSWLGNSNFGF